jgi:Skp family chaperone for outer membrane proteins
MEGALAEERRVVAELQKTAKQIEAEELGLKAFKPGSSGYIAGREEILRMQTELESKRNYHKRRIEMEDKRWNEQFYLEVLKIVGKVAQEKGLDMVFEQSEPQLPAANANELGLLIRTHKLLYCGGCIDITQEVMSRLDAAGSGN